MERARGQKNSESECLNVLWVRTDHLVTFAHPNENVVPLLFTTPMLRQHRYHSLLCLLLASPPCEHLCSPKHGPKWWQLSFVPQVIFFTFFFQLTNLFPCFLDSNYVVTTRQCQHGTHIHLHMPPLQAPARRVDDRATQPPTTSRAEQTNEMGANDDWCRLGPR